MSNLNVALNYFEHPKTKRLVGRLGRGAEVLPLKLWAYCGRVHPIDGRLSGYTKSEIESIVSWWGSAGRCVDELVATGFIERTDDGYQVHEWLDYQGHIAAFQERAKKAAAARWGRIDPSGSNATSIATDDGKQSPNLLTNHTPPKPPKGGGMGRRVSRKDAAMADLERLKREEEARRDAG